MAVLPLIGKALMFPLKHWFVSSAAITAADYQFNDSKLMKDGMDKASGFISDLAQQGFSRATENLDLSIRESIDETFGPGSKIGEFLGNHWGKLAGGALSLGLLTYGSGWGKVLGVIGAGAVAYMTYQQLAKSGFNASANGNLTRPIVDMGALKEKADQLVGTGATFAQPLLKPIVTQPEPQNQ